MEGHNDCARALENNVTDHLSKVAPLDPLAQELLLDEVEVSFTEEDNNNLKAAPTTTEVKKVL